jgi:hypothetical protein
MGAEAGGEVGAEVDGEDAETGGEADGTSAKSGGGVGGGANTKSDGLVIVEASGVAGSKTDGAVSGEIGVEPGGEDAETGGEVGRTGGKSAKSGEEIISPLSRYSDLLSFIIFASCGFSFHLCHLPMLPWQEFSL